MEFSIKNYYKVQDELSTKQMVDIFLVDLDFYFNSFKKMLEKAKNEPDNFVFPKSSSVVAKKMKYWIVVMCIFLEKITDNPMFLMNAETFLKNDKVCTIDAFSFFLRIFNEKLNDNIFNKTIINAYCELLKEYEGISYNASIEQLLKIDDRTSKTEVNENWVNLIIK